MGLEKYIDTVIEQFDPSLHGQYYWDHGLCVPNGAIAEVIMYLLDDSGEFGPTRYNPVTTRIEMGVHYRHFKGTPAAYNRYVAEFKSRFTLN